MKLAFANAKQLEILSELQTVGITAAILDADLAEITNLENLSQILKREYGEQSQRPID